MNRVTLIGRARTQLGDGRFALVVGDMEIAIAHDRLPSPGERVAVEGGLRTDGSTLYVEARTVDVLPYHMV
ncbi:MAG: hypothetical protein ACYC1P_12270 [Gaiellaceae bacterium]